MLDLDHATGLSEDEWRRLPKRAALPSSVRDFLRGDGIRSDRPTTRRRYQRIGMRSIAIAALGEERLAVFTKDLSRMGVGFYSPVNMLPRTVIRLQLPNKKALILRVARCRRIDQGCFECGATFDFGTDGKLSSLTL